MIDIVAVLTKLWMSKFAVFQEIENKPLYFLNYVFFLPNLLFRYLQNRLTNIKGD